MNCTDFERETQELLDQRLSELPSELGDHAASCAICRSYWDGQLTLLAAAGTWKPVPASSGLMAAVLSALTRPEAVELGTSLSSSTVPLKPVRRGSGWAAISATAVLAVLAVTLFRLSPRMAVNDRRVDLAGSSHSAEPVEMTLAFTGLWQGVHDEYQELSHETSRLLEGIGELPPPSVSLPAMPAKDIPSEAAPSESPAGSPWLKLHRPVSDRVGRAFDFLKDALPDDSTRSS